jgi:hypothetical protein
MGVARIDEEPGDPARCFRQSREVVRLVHLVGREGFEPP